MRWIQEVRQVLGVVAVLAWAALTTPVIAVDDLRLSVAAGSETVAPGDTVTVTLDVANLSSSINGVQLLLNYDNALLTLVDIVPDTVVSLPAEGWVEVSETDSNGDVVWAAVINGDSIFVGHRIATLTFTAIGEGATSVTFRPDAVPFFTKLTDALDNTTILPENKFPSGLIILTCDDGLFCNGAETFDGTTCQPGADPCDDGVACTVDSCDEVFDTCTNTPDDTLCDDSLFCDGVETCDALLDCQPGADPCDDGVACTVNTCDEIIDACTNTPDDTLCDNSLFCDGVEICDALLDCQPGADPCDDGVACTLDTCDEISDACTNAPDDTACGNGLFCDGAEICDAVLGCQSGTDPCDDGVACTVDTCDEVANACGNTVDDTLCDDGLFCNGTETCDAALDCQPGTDPCDDGVACTVDVCDEVANACGNTADDTLCDDGLFCNGAETCDAALDCQAGTNPCDDGVACTVDTCDEVADTCTNTTDDAFCDDALFCNGTETCDAALDCQPGTSPCDDGVACTLDTCDDVLDSCINTPDDTLCDDTLFCNGVETCDAALDCQPGTNPCNDGVACTLDTCDDVLDSCDSTADDTLCDDGLFCNGAETCDLVLDCQPGTNPCDDGVACTLDTCDEVLNACANTPDDALCDNGLFCDGAEICDPALDCQPGSDPCAPLPCDEVNAVCISAPRIVGLELFYAGRFSDDPDPSRSFLAAGSTADGANVSNYERGITGIRIFFDQIVEFATTADAALSFDWTTGSDTAFTPVTDVSLNITVTETVQASATVVTIVIVDDHVRRRWLRVAVDSTQVSAGGAALDGELFGNPVSFPSGDSAPGGDAVFYTGNVPGDVTGDLKTALGDVGAIRLQVNPFVAVPVTSGFDVNKDGKVLLEDVGEARQDVNPFFTLPLIGV